MQSPLSPAEKAEQVTACWDPGGFEAKQKSLIQTMMNALGSEKCTSIIGPVQSRPSSAGQAEQVTACWDPGGLNVTVTKEKSKDISRREQFNKIL